VLAFGYIVERNGLPVHYFVFNIYSLKVIANFFLTARFRNAHL
jgi:hypothetical protein